MNVTKKIVAGLVCLAAALFAGISASAEQTLAEKTRLTGAKAIAKFPARLQNSEIAHLADASWCQLMQGVEYFYGKFDLLYNTTKNDVSFFKIDYKNAPLRMKFVDNRRNGGSNKQTSYVANKYNALFGINCTFPAWYAKMEGTVVKDGNKEGGLALNDDKTFEFFNSSWWKDHPSADGYSDAFSTEAMGLYHGSQGLSGTGWGQAPYTFMGATQDGILYVCVVDGRSSRSEGLGYGTTHSFLVELGCYDGMCIDGGGSTTMVCKKSLMPPFPECKMNELQHASDNVDANPYYYTMNHTSDNPEREVCNQLLFVEDVASVTPDIGRHGSCKLGSTALGTALIKFDKNVTLTLSVTADSGYVIASLSVDGTMVGEAKGRASYSDSILLKGDKAIAVSFVKKGAWWLNPTVKNDFLLEAKAGNNGSDLTTQHPDVCLDEQEQDVFFSTSVHGYSSGSYWSAIHEYSVANLKGWQTGDAIAPVMGTRKNLVSGDYAYAIAASQAAGVALAMQKTTGGTKYPVVYPIGGQWGGGTEFNSTRDDRYVEAKLSFPDDKTGYHSAYPCVFGTDGTYLYGGYNRNAHFHEFRVTTDANGRKQFEHTGKVIKHKASVTAAVCKKVTLGGQAKDVLFTAHHSSSLDSLDIVIPGEMAVQTNSSSLPTCLNISYKLDNIAVTGIADGTPRIIGHVLDTNNPQHGNYVVYDLKDDLSGLRFPDPIAIVNAQSVFGKATGCLASLDDDTTAFINYYNAKELHALTVQGDASVEPPAELIPVAKPTAKTGLVYTGKSQTGVAAATGYTVSNGSGTSVGSYTATVTLEDGYCWADESTAALSLPWSIGKAALTVTAENKTVTYGSAAPAFTATYSGFVNGETATALDGALAFDCAYTATTAAGSTLDIKPKGLTSSNYAITFAKGTLTVNKATYDMGGVTFADATVGYDGQPHSLAVAGLPSGVTATYDVKDVTAAGAYAITASFTGDANHEAITATKKATLTISRRAVTVKAKDRTIGLGMTPSAFGYDVTAGSLVSGETLSGALACAADGKSAGTWSITQGTLTDANNPNYAITFVGGTLTVVQLTAVLNPATAGYDGTAKDPTVTVTDSSGAALAAGSFTVTKPAGEVKDAGTYSYGIAILSGDLAGLELTASFTIKPKKVNVAVTAGQKKTYGAADPSEFACTKDALVGTDAYSGALARADGENVGKYAISQGTLTAGKNYAIAFTGADFEITKKELTVTAKPVSLIYGDEKPATFECDFAGFANGDAKDVVKGEPTFTCDYAKGSDVGTYDITVGVGGLSADNYTFAGVKGMLTVGQKTPTLSAVTATAITYCQTLADSVVSATVDPDVAGTFAWTDASLAPAVADGGVTVYTGTFTPNDTKNYRAAAFETTVIINRKEIAVPTANTGLVFNFSEQTGVEAGEGYTLTGEKATAAGDYEATASLTDKDNTCWADDQTFVDKTIAWSIAESTVEVAGVAEAGTDWNGSEVTLDITGLNIGSHELADLLATFEVNGKTYDGEVTARGEGAYGVAFVIDAEGENAVVAAEAYEGTYRVTLGGEGDEPVEVASGTQSLVQGFPLTDTNGWFRETAATLGQTGTWQRGGEAAELPVEAGRIVIEPTDAAAPLSFTPTKTMDERTKGVIEMGYLYEGSSDEDDAAPAGNPQCAVRIAEDDETETVKLQVYAALPDGEGGWSVGWHDWNQAAAETYAFVVGTEYMIRLICDYETGTNGLKCYVKAADEEEFVLLFDGYLTGAADAASVPKRVASLALEGTGKVSIVDGDFTHDYLDASVAKVGGERFATVADAVAAANGAVIALLHKASWKPTFADLDRAVRFSDKALLAIDLSELGGGYEVVWTEGDGGWSAVVKSTQPEIIDAERIGVCSWSWHDDMTSILARMKKGGFKGMQLALSPWIWDAGEATVAQAETFGDVEGDEVLALIRQKAAAGEIVIHATMIAFADEDYTSTTTISNTCGLFYGLAPSATDEQRANAESKWAHRSNQFERAAILTGELCVPYLTAHLGLSGLDDAAKGYPRLAWAVGVCKQNGCKLLIETGMYSAEATSALLTNLVAAHPELAGWVGLNFDSANQILYGTDNPTHAFPILRQWIDQVHIKDCVEDLSLRGGWATDVEWGLGDVSTKYDFIEYLRVNGFKGPLLVEHESGEATADARAKEILTAVQALLTSNNADDPTCPTPDWIDPSLMEGDTPAEREEAAMKAQGFDEEAAAAVAEAGAYETVSEWSQAWANDWQARGEAKKPMPADIAAIPGVLTSAAIGAAEPLTEEDVKITELKPANDGAVTVTVSLGEYENLKSGNEALLKAALGVTGAYGFGEGASFSADNVDVTAKAVDAAAVELQAVPKKQDGVKPARFFFRATAR